MPPRPAKPRRRGRPALGDDARTITTPVMLSRNMRAEIRAAIKRDRNGPKSVSKWIVNAIEIALASSKI